MNYVILKGRGNRPVEALATLFNKKVKFDKKKVLRSTNHCWIDNPRAILLPKSR